MLSCSACSSPRPSILASSATTSSASSHICSASGVRCAVSSSRFAFASTCTRRGRISCTAYSPSGPCSATTTGASSCSSDCTLRWMLHSAALVITPSAACAGAGPSRGSSATACDSSARRWLPCARLACISPGVGSATASCSRRRAFLEVGRRLGRPTSALPRPYLASSHSAHSVLALAMPRLVSCGANGPCGAVPSATASHSQAARVSPAKAERTPSASAAPSAPLCQSHDTARTRSFSLVSHTHPSTVTRLSHSSTKHTAAAASIDARRCGASAAHPWTSTSASASGANSACASMVCGVVPACSLAAWRRSLRFICSTGLASSRSRASRAGARARSIWRSWLWRPSVAQRRHPSTASMPPLFAISPNRSPEPSMHRLRSAPLASRRTSRSVFDSSAYRMRPTMFFEKSRRRLRSACSSSSNDEIDASAHTCSPFDTCSPGPAGNFDSTGTTSAFTSDTTGAVRRSGSCRAGRVPSARRDLGMPTKKWKEC